MDMNFRKAFEKLNTVIKEEKAQEKPTLQKKAGRLFVGFFLLISLLTIVSRAADSLTVAVVSAGPASKSTLSFKAWGDGIIEVETEKPVMGPAEYSVDTIFVKEGQKVTAGEGLYSYHIEEIQEALDELKIEEQKLNINLQKEGLTNYFSSLELSGEEQYKEALLDYQEAELEEANTEENLKVDLEAAKEKQKKAQEDYNKAKDKLSETALEDAQDTYDAAEKALMEAAFTRDRELEENKRKIQDKKKALDKLNNDDNPGQVQQAINRYNMAMERGDESEIIAAQAYLDEVLYGESGIENHKNAVEQAELALKRAKDDEKILKENWETKIAWLEKDLSKAEEDLAKAKRGEYDEDKLLAAERQALDAAKENVTTAQRACEENTGKKELRMQKAQRAIDSALEQIEKDKEKAQEDEETKQNQEKQAALAKKSIQIDMEKNRRDRMELEALLEEKGVVKAPVDGIVTRLNIEVGKKAPDGLAAFIGAEAQGFLLKAKITEETVEDIAVGDTVKITLKGERLGFDAVVTGMKPLQDGGYEMTAALPEGEYVSGSTAAFSSEKNTEVYPYCIPLSALREDQKGYFVYIMQPEQSVLGNQEVVRRLNVDLVEKDSSIAAIQGAIQKEDMIISESSKNISEGDRVRLIK